MNTNNCQSNRSTTNNDGADELPTPTLRELMRRHRAKEAATPPAVTEALEARTLRTVTASVSGGGTILTVSSDSADNIAVGYDGTKYVVRQGGSDIVGSPFGGPAITSIFVNAGGGDDTITLATLSNPIGGDKLYIGCTINAGDGADQVFGSDNGDLIRGDNSTDLTATSTTVTGYEDVLHGGAGADTISGQYSSDTILGEGGADFLYGDFINVDEASISEAGDSIDGGAQDDYIQGDGNGNSAYGDDSGADSLYGGDDNDNIVGDGSAVSVGGADIIHGGTGNDSILAGYMADSVYGENGNDTVRGSFGNDSIFGGNDDDRLFGDDDQDRVYGDAGSDSLEGGAGNDTIGLFAGNDTALGNDGDDQFVNVLDDESDLLDGGAGTDSVLGGLDNDTLTGAVDTPFNM